jgi:iron complex outermembrane receptor protein
MNSHYRTLIALGTFLALFQTTPGLAQSKLSDELIVTATRLSTLTTGTSVTVIEEEDIRRSPAEDLPNLLGLEAGVYNRDLFSGVTGAQATVDVRGFGAVGTQNTLLLLDGRRLNDIDLAAVDFTNIPLSSIKKIEIIRGNAGSVLYGDGAVGGVINIVTKSPAKRPDSADIEYAIAQQQRHEINMSASQSRGPYSLNLSSNFVKANGFRDNNNLLQRNALGQLRYTGGRGEAFIKLGGDFQSLGLPGARLIDRGTGTDEFVSARNEATTPIDKALQNGLRLSLGLTRELSNGTEVIVDGGLRKKDQDSFINDNTGGGFNQTIDTELTTWSLTPRANLDWMLNGRDHQSVVGVDFYYADYDSDRSRNRNEAPVHRYLAHQTTFGLYGQDDFKLSDVLTAQVGGRFIWNKFSGGDEFNPNAPGANGFVGKRETTGAVNGYYLYNIGLEYKIAQNLAVFGRTGRSIRLPTIDERIASSDGSTFKLKTQISRDVELGLRYQTEKLALQGSAFAMKLKNELRFDPTLGGGFGLNENSAPTRRIGSEMAAGYEVTNSLKLQLNVAFIDAKFREGVFADNQVPLVPQWQLGSQLNWHLIEDKLIATLSANYIDRARLENDESNEGEQIPDYYLIDLRFGGQLGQEEYSGLNWSIELTNLLDKNYYNYGVRSTTNIKRFNVYPLAGRVMRFTLGRRF